MSDAKGAGRIVDSVSAYEDTMVLPTFGVGFDEPNTPFMQPGGYPRDVCFPNPFRTHFLREQPVERTYRRVVLENAYLRVEFAPDLGGMVWRLYDKIHQAEAIQHMDRVKPTHGGFGGSYVDGGIELNYPFAHSITNTWPRKTQVEKNQDGSATYTVSEWERVGRTLWAMSFTLSPGEARLKQRVMAYNRSKLPLSFCYWGNAGVPVSMDTKWLYREIMGSEHGGSTVYIWPEFRGVDLSHFKTDHEVIGIYFLEPKYNFFGIVDEATRSGLVHYADRHEVPGKKLWTWGRNFSGENREYHLSVEPSPYGEIQSGRLQNQEHFEWLMPEEFLSWDEQWAPIYGLTDVSEVTEDAAFQLVADERKVLYYPFTRSGDQKLRVALEGKTLRELPFSVGPSELGSIDLSDLPREAMDKLEVCVVKGEKITGSISLANRCERKPAGEIREDPAFDPGSSMACFINAEFNHKLLHRKKAAELYERALKLDRHNYQAHTGLGRLLFSHGDLVEARKHFARAVEIYKWDTEAHLMLSHIAHLDGKLDEALEEAHNARYFGDKCRANIKLAEIYIAKGQHETAIGYLEDAVANNRMSLRSYALIALCERKLGRKISDRAPEIPLKDLIWYSEQWFREEITAQQLRQALFSDEWRYLELGLIYTELGLYEEAEKLLDEGILLHKNGWELESIYNPERIWGICRKRETPFLHLLKGYIALKTGREDAAKAHFRQGDYYEFFVNPNQPELVAVLEKAIEHGSVSAAHYLGNYLYHSHRYDEARKWWEAAEAAGNSNSVNSRNLAVYAKNVAKDNEKARALYREALRKNPNDLFLRQEVAAIERDCGASADEILALYLEAPEEQKATILFGSVVGAYTSAGKWEEAIDFMSQVDRSHADEDSGWYFFCLSYADHLLESGRPREALEWIGKARQTPRNLSYVTYSDDYYHLFAQQEYYQAGLACKALGETDKAQEYFRKAIEQPADFHYFRPWEDLIRKAQFYVALSMKELGMESAARILCSGINSYREPKGLIALSLDKSELKRWGEKDPDAITTAVEQTGPEI